jgi:hypothetical protein
MLDNASVPSTDRHFVCNNDQKWALLGSSIVNSIDHNSVKVLVDGSIDSFMGFKFHFLPNDRFTVNAVDAGCYECFAYHRDAVLMTTGKDIDTRITVMPTKNYSVQAWAEMFIGAVRLQGPGVVKVLLDKDPVGSYS